MHFQPYSKYKPSGIDWLGEIPEVWEVKRLKEISNNIYAGGTPSTIIDEYWNKEDYIWLPSGELQNKIIYQHDDNKFVSKLGLQNSSTKLIEKNTVLIALTGATCANIGYLTFKACANQSVVAITNSQKFYSKFLFYFLLIKRSYIKVFQTGGAQAGINTEDVKNLWTGLPPKSEQIAIADYLDKHTALIDKKIELLKAKKQSYTQLKQTLINEVVTKGLDTTVEMKDSGIEWIGQIPKHWEVKRLKDLINIFTGNSIAEKDLFLNKKNSYPYIATKDIDIETNQIDYNNGIYIPKSDKNFKIAKKDSVLLCIEGANAGKKIAQTEMDICFVNKQCAMKSLNNKVVERYLFYFIQGGIFKSQFFLVLNGLIGGVSINLIKRIFLVIPQKSEQIAIANYLDEKTSKIDQIIKKIDKNILALQEFRKTLINDVVTGKVKVL